ncbi:MAG: pentapeptide repeat-containing protein [Crinalium sp.]
MDQGTDKNNLNWLSPDALIEFIDELREAGYKIGISQYIAAHDLIWLLIAQGEALDSPERLRNLLGPIFCSSPIEQEEFQQRFNRWVELYSRLNLLTGEVNIEAKAFADELATERALSYRMQSSLIFIALFIAALSIILFFQHTDNTSSIKPTPPTPTQTPPTPTQTPIIDINPSTKTSPNLPFDWEILILLLTVNLVIFIIRRLWWLWRANLFLQRHSTTQQPELQKISINGLEEKLVPSITLLEIARSLKYRIRIPSNELDVDKTINATLRQGGWLTPVYRNYQVLPEYLFLVNRVSYRDHQAKFVEEIIARLKNEGVFITVYFFDDDPRICFSSEENSPLRLKEITSKYNQHCLVIISDTDIFFSSINEKLEPWVNQLTTWDKRAVLTPTPVENWGYKELELAQRFIILPATIKGLLVLSQRLRQGFATYFLAEEQRIPLPDSLHIRSYIWIERNPPPIEQINAMLDSLEKYLGKDSFYWLSACAIFPQLDWQITIYLGNVLKTESGALLIEVCSLTDLARLPWLRYGYMPDWLRVYLIATLTQEQQQVIRSILQDLLITSVQGSVSKLQLEIARQYPNLLPKLANPILKILSKKATFDSPLRDYIFLGFMREKSLLSLKVSDEFSRLLQKQKRNYWWMKALRKLGIMIKPQIHQPSFAASANTSSSLRSCRQILKWLGLGGVGILTSVVAHQVTKNSSQNLHETSPSGLAKEFVKASVKKQRTNILKSASVFLIFPLIGTLISVHLQIISRANSILYRDDCKPNPEAKYLTEYMVRFGYKNQLRGINLCNQNLANINLKGTNLSEGNLKNSNLSGANLQNTSLEDTNLSKAYLVGADLTFAYLNKTILKEANLEDANLTGVTLIHNQLANVYIRGANMSKSNILNVNFLDADLSNVDLTDANIEEPINLSVEQISKAKLCRTILPENIRVNRDKNCKK